MPRVNDMEPLTSEWYEREVLIHRYLYYVLGETLVSDFEYDIIERKAREVCPGDSVVQGVGSSLPSSYPSDVTSRAMLRFGYANGM